MTKIPNKLFLKKNPRDYISKDKYEAEETGCSTMNWLLLLIFIASHNPLKKEKIYNKNFMFPY